MPRGNSAQERTMRSRLLVRVRRATGRSDRAEDYLHSAFVKLETYRAENAVANPEALLVRIAANMAIDEVRRERVRGESGHSVYDLTNLASMQPLQDEVFETRKRLDKVRDGLAQLRPRTREIFLMHRIEGMKYREIAEHCGISVSAVEKHIAKAALFLAHWTEGW